MYTEIDGRHAAQLIVRILQQVGWKKNNLSVQKTKTAYNASNTGICNNSWTSLVAKLVKNPPEMQETWFDP